MYGLQTMRKAQVIGQVFIYILTVVIIGAILLVGYRAIKSSKDRMEQVTLLEFQKGIESSIKTISNQFGTVRQKDFRLTGDYKEVCFLENYEFNPGLNYQNIMRFHPLIFDSLRNGQPTSNVFLVKFQGPGESYDIGKISVPGAFLCIPVQQGIMTVTFEGKGDHVIVT